MYSNPKLSYAIAAILSSSAIGISHAATATDTSDVEGIQEITVTAQRRTENIQNVPIAMQALTGDSLTQLNVQTVDDFVRYLPNVTAPTNGPGQGNIYMRGLSSGGVAGTQSSGTTGAFPNVAIYLDDQSGQLPGRNLDIYAADLERIEVLEGPQGTLFGAGAQAGVIRYITNKPKLNVTEGSVTAGYGTTAGGDNNSNVEAMINLPLISDHLAARAVIYNDSRGGYIDNVAGTFTRKNSDLGIYYANYATACAIGAPSATGLCAPVLNAAGKNTNKGTAFAVPPGTASINNNAFVADNINPVTYQGIRAELLYQVNDDWNVLLSQTYQNINAQGVFYAMPRSSDGALLGKDQVTVFNPNYDKDKFENTALTVNGKIGFLKAVYTGAYLRRNLDQVNDYTNYARGVYADYYQCRGANNSPTGTAQCFSPQTSWREQEKNTHMSHEFRLSTPDDLPLRGILGAFYEDLKIFDQTDWFYKTLPACTTVGQIGCLTDIGPPAGATSNNPATRSDNDSFFEDVTRGYTQYAIFTSIDYDIIPKVLTITGGTRYFRFENTMKGSKNSSFGCLDAGPAPCTAGATNIDAENLKSNFSGFKSRGNITWHVLPDALVYFTYSQGFRPGAFNRVSQLKAGGQYYTPISYTSDELINKEIGFKTEFLDHKIQVNGALYQENWNNVQTAFFDPGQLGNLTFGTNGPNYKVRGIELAVVARITQGLTVQGSTSYNKSEQTNSPFLINNNPLSAAYGSPITSISNPYGTIGSPTANSPLAQGNIRARYEFKFNDYNMFGQVGGTYTSSSFTQSGSSLALAADGAVNSTLVRFENPSYAQYDASAGIAKDAWNVEFFGQNLANKYASVFTSTGQFVEAQTVIRPRVLGVKFGYKF
jgi:iron complex outermembrane receptor protein